MGAGSQDGPEPLAKAWENTKNFGATVGSEVSDAAKKTGDAIGDAAKKTGDAIGDAAKKTGDFMVKASSPARKSMADAGVAITRTFGSLPLFAKEPEPEVTTTVAEPNPFVDFFKAFCIPCKPAD